VVAARTWQPRAGGGVGARHGSGPAVKAGEWGTDRWVPHNTVPQFKLIQIGQTHSNKIQTVLNKIQIHSSYDRSKKDLPGLKKFRIKYGIEGFEERNNFLHRNFFIFKVDLKLNFREALGLEFG
jgi:hypothetical protein